MNCAERLVTLFGSQAEVARRLPARPRRGQQLGEVGLRPVALGDGDRARHRRPHRRRRHPQRSGGEEARPREIPARGRVPRVVHPRERHHGRLCTGEAHLLVPPAAAHADGSGPDRDPPARAHDDEPAGDRLPRPGLRRDDGGAEEPAPLRLPDEEPAHLPDLGPGLGRDGVLLRQPGGARRQGRRLPQRRVRRPDARERRALRRRADRRRRRVGHARSTRTRSRTR